MQNLVKRTFSCLIAFLFVAGIIFTAVKIRDFIVRDKKEHIEPQDWALAQFMDYLNHGDKIYSLAISSNGKLIATGGDNSKILLWNTDTHTLLRIQPIWNGAPQDYLKKKITSLAFTSDNDFLISRDINGSLLRWSLDTGKPVIGKRILGYQYKMGERPCLALSPDNKFIAVNDGIDGAAILSPSTFDYFRDGIGFGKNVAVHSLSFSPNNNFLAIGLWDGVYFLWNTQTHQIFSRIETPTRVGGRDISISQDSKLLALNNWFEVFIWDITKNQFVGTDTIKIAPTTSIAFSQSCNVLAIGLDDGRIIFWSTEKKQFYMQQLALHHDVVSGLAFSADGKFMVSSSYDGKAILWRVGSL